MRIKTVVFVYALLTPFAFGETTITINGRTIGTSGSSITVYNKTVVYDEKILSENMVVGSGKIGIENRNLTEFETLYLDINADVTVVKGKKTRCVITADDNILPVIITKSADKILRISAKDSYSSRQKVEVAIETPQLKKAEINGAGTVAVTGVLKDRVDLVISGSGDITAKGQVKELIATINGSGDLHAADLQAITATVIINGSGDADVHATAYLSAKVNGSGNITYLGTPSNAHTSVKGSGTISKK